MKCPTMPESFTQWSLNVKSGLSDINVVKYNAQPSDSGGVWIIGDCPNAADHTYHGYTDRAGDGFGGRHITFDLVNGGKITLKGPFKSSPPEHWGLKVLTRGVIGTSISNHPDSQDYFGPLRTYHNVLHLDRDWVLGEYERVDAIAQSLANKINKKVYFRRESQGGAISSYANPQRNTKEEVADRRSR